jgi:hypothetical protein
MDEPNLERVTRSRRLTPEEVVRDEEVRRKVREEFPPVHRDGEDATDSLNQTRKRAMGSPGKEPPGNSPADE